MGELGTYDVHDLAILHLTNPLNIYLLKMLFVMVKKKMISLICLVPVTLSATECISLKE